MRIPALIFLLTIPQLAHARYRMGEDKPISAGEAPRKAKTSRQRAAPRTDGELTVQEFLANRFSVPQKKIAEFRKKRNGYEEIVPALIVARQAQVAPDRILEMRAEGTPWNAIAKTFEVDLKPLNREVIDVLEPIRRAVPEQALTERPRESRAPR